MSLYSHRQPPFGTSKGTRSIYTSWATPLCLGKVQFLRLVTKEHKRRGTTTATGSTGKGQQGDLTLTLIGRQGTQKAAGGTMTRHDDGDGRLGQGAAGRQAAQRRQRAARRRGTKTVTGGTTMATGGMTTWHDNGNGWHDNGKGQ